LICWGRDWPSFPVPARPGGDQLDRRADIAYPERLDSHGAAGGLRRTPSRDRIQRPNGCALQPYRDSLGDKIGGQRRATRQVWTPSRMEEQQAIVSARSGHTARSRSVDDSNRVWTT
jgi:hypothetical protein